MQLSSLWFSRCRAALVPRAGVCRARSSLKPRPRRHFFLGTICLLPATACLHPSSLFPQPISGCGFSSSSRRFLAETTPIARDRNASSHHLRKKTARSRSTPRTSSQLAYLAESIIWQKNTIPSTRKAAVAHSLDQNRESRQVRACEAGLVVYPGVKNPFSSGHRTVCTIGPCSRC